MTVPFVRIRLISVVLGVAVALSLFSGCASDVVEVEISDGSTYAAPQEVGVIDARSGTKFKAYSTVGGLNAVVRFQVGSERNYHFYLEGTPSFDITVRRSQMTGALLALSQEGEGQVSLSPGTDYYIEFEQSAGASMGAFVLKVTE
jgi:hypothetical protein